MIDWMTLKLPLTHVQGSALDVFLAKSGRILCIDGLGEKQWEKINRQSVRSDSHQLVVDISGDYFLLHGSPARVRYSNNVFGSGDPVECALDMIRFAIIHTGIELPLDVAKWRCTRMDITQNYDLGTAAEVRQALNYLRHTEGGRYQVRTASESIYWSSNSALRSGKAYHKGPHLLYQIKKNQATAAEHELKLSDRLLRLELCLKSQYWRERSEKKWYQFTESELDKIHDDYFSQFVGKIEVIEMDKLQDEFKRVAKTPGQGMSAYRTWSLIKSIGIEETRASMPRRTWFNHLKIIKAAGLTFADLQARNVLPFRRRSIQLGQPVRAWQDIAA